MVDDFEARPAEDLDAEITWLAKTIPMLQRQKAAALQARRRKRRKVAK
ncbi:hypothetical protein [uncultured Luteimonas sp.]|nr:hypothetical protein [uncultured Luteimonas sp.]